MTDQKEREDKEQSEFLTVLIDDQTFGIPALKIQDVLGAQKVTRIPLSSPEISGLLNLRGRIVTAINLRRRLGVEPLPEDKSPMSVVVEHKGELYSLVVDSVGEVLSLEEKDFEKTPVTLQEEWREISSGVYRLKESLLIVLDVAALLDSLQTAEDQAA